MVDSVLVVLGFSFICILGSLGFLQMDETVSISTIHIPDVIGLSTKSIMID